MVDISKNKLRQMYKEEKMLKTDIANELGCSYLDVLIKLKEYGIQPNMGKSWNTSSNRVIPDVTHSSELSYILGVLKGDLYVDSNNHSLDMKSVDKPFIKSVSDSLKCIGLNPDVKECEQKANKGYFKGWRLWASSKAFCDWYESLELEDIGQLINGYEVDFIKGFYESEGCNSYLEYIHPESPPDKEWWVNQWQISMASSDKEIILFVKQLLEDFEFSPYIVTTEATNSPNNEYMHELKVKREECEKFIQTIAPYIKNEVY